ncbi:MAG: ADP-ribosylglycohydrolase family protein [Cellulosilyticaceae bacterium]
MKRDFNHIHGCLAGGAIGDALGAPVEFMDYNTIIKKYGEMGITELVVPVVGQKAVITDDTQLTLFTAEGLLRSIVRTKQKNLEKTNKDTSIIVFRAYLRWLYTQGLKTPHWDSKSYDGWLVKVKRLHAYREPGVTCITSLGKGVMGSINKPINDSEKCGGVIRVAPVGLLEDEENVFDVGCRIGAITHGHPTAYLSTGALGTIIYYITEGLEIEEAVNKTIEKLMAYEGSGECIELIKMAVELSKQGEPGVDKIKQLGEGFIARETVAIGIYCALAYQDNFKKAVLLAVNHDGDSDSTGAVTGNILGAYLGMDKIDADLAGQIELAAEIKQISEDILTKYEEGEAWMKKYPGW